MLAYKHSKWLVKHCSQDQCSAAVGELPCDGVKVMTGQEVRSGRGTLTAVRNHLEALKAQGMLVLSLYDDRMLYKDGRPRGLQVRLLHIKQQH